jgi:hypothetical protein
MAELGLRNQVSLPKVQHVVELKGLTVGIIREMPRPAELFGEYVDMVVLSDSVATPAFSRMFNSSSLGTSGFLSKRQLDEVHDWYGHRARNPIRLFHVARSERMSARAITERCSLLSLGAMDRRYPRKSVLFVPSLARADARLRESNSGDYVEAAMYVAAFTKSRAIYFAGFDGGDGSFSNDAIVKLAARIYVARHALHLEPLQVYFKYPLSASSVWVNHLASQLKLLESSSTEAMTSGHRAVRAA